MRLCLYLKHFPLQGEPLKVGTNKAVHGLASGLVANGADVSVLCEGEQDGRNVAEAGYEILCFRNSARYRTFRVAPGLKAYFEDPVNADCLVVLNGIFHPSLYSLSRILIRRGVPYVVAPHGPYHPTLFQKNAYLKWPYWYLVERQLLNQARAIQLLDSRHALWSRRLGVDRPVIEAPNGFSPADVVPESRLGWRARGPVRLLYWGRLDVHTKGLDILLQAYALLKTTEEAMLTVQGPDWTGQQGAVEEMVEKLHDPEHVSLLPPEFDTPAPLMMNQHDIVCLPSRFEGFGLAALEAMLAGRVVVVSDGAGIAPHVAASGCGIVVEPEPEAVRDGVLELLLRRPEWPEMGLAGRRYALQHLHWNTIAGGALEQYRRLVH